MSITMHAMKKEMLPILARLQGIRNLANTLNLAITELDTACGDCDGSSNSVDAVGRAADKVRAIGEHCGEIIAGMGDCAHRCCQRLC